jgi:DNA mismatch repair protein MutS2
MTAADVETRLGFDQIRQKLMSYCLGDPGKQRVARLALNTHYPSLMESLQQTHEALRLISRGDVLPLRTYDDPRLWFQVAAIEGNFLEAPDLMQLRQAWQSVIETRQVLIKGKEDAPHLWQLTVPVTEARTLYNALHQQIDEEGRIKDNATPELMRIRRRLRDEQSKVRRVAEALMRQARDAGWAPEGAMPTIRDGRLVIPVLAEHKRKIRGYVMDQSSTGQTVYLEPGEVMEANNDLRDLELEERQEVVRILRELTSLVRKHLPELETGYDFLGAIDFIQAKARYAREIEAILPLCQQAPALRWINARHPILLQTLKGKRTLVPLTIDLHPEEHFLLVSGPNAGGKSVCLKTVGLIQYMFQTGLLIPVSEGSVAGIFDAIFLDIGDQQSIENDLSTYSSHLKNMDQFIRHATASSLVLMDELGSGTDPNFGGGIAQAVLEQLLLHQVWGLATTHYYNLKVFASNHPGIRNAAMLFDIKTLSPLYRLEIGQPGSSFALEIARKTGLSADTLKSAERIIGKELTGLETLMKEVAEGKQAIVVKEREIRHREEETEKLMKQYEQLHGQLEKQKKEILNRAKSEASVLLQETNREIEKTIRHIRENKAEKQETRKVRQGLKDLEKKVKPAVQAAIRPHEPLVEGDKVRMTGGEVTGTILTIRGKTATVQFGDLRSSVKLERLVRSDLANETTASRPPVRGIELHERQSRFNPVMDVRGMRVEELLPLLTRFLDDAVLLGQPEVRIIHGKGEGVLRKVVREYLTGLKALGNFRDEHADRGGEGITIVTLR